MSSYKCCSDNSLTTDEFDVISKILKLVSEESRLRLMCLLCKGEHCVCDMLPHLKMSQSLVSHHLRDLKDAGVVSDRKDGLKVYYSLTDYGRVVAKNIFSLKKERYENK